MGRSADSLGYPTRGALTNELFVAVRSTLPPVVRLLSRLPRFQLESGPVAAEVSVIADPSAPQRRYFVHEYYTRVEWLSATHARVETNGATGSIDWPGGAGDVLQAELRIFPEGAPESVGMFLRLLTSMLLPTRRSLLVHASAVVHHGKALIFLGNSGAGKTTTARRSGREGALRIADDLTILHVGRDRSVHVEPCSFDRGGRLPGRALRVWPVGAAYDVRKAAPLTEDLGRVRDPLATWCAAILSSTGPASTLESLLSLTLDLNQAIPPRILGVRASGSVLSAFSVLGPSAPVTSTRPLANEAS